MREPTPRRGTPQIAQVSSISSIMLDVIIALIPALGMGVYLFGLRALVLVVLSILTCVGSEALYRRGMGQDQTVGDLSACVTGLLLGMSLPVTAPYWAPILGGMFAIIVVKQLYGGLGRNFMNPALGGYMLLHTFPGLMTRWVDAFQRPPLLGRVDLISTATPMAALHQGELPVQEMGQLLLGQHGGSIGGVSTVMILLGGLYLVARRVIHLPIPLTFLGTVALVSLLFPGGGQPPWNWMLAQLSSGGLMLGAVFMASDYTTTPVTPRGQLLFGVGCGLLTMLLRSFGSYAEGVGWAILTMNCCVWLLDSTGMPRRFGVSAFAETKAWIQSWRQSVAQLQFVPLKPRLFARAGEGTMPGEGYLDELRSLAHRAGALISVVAVTGAVVFWVHWMTDYAIVRSQEAAQQELLAQVMPQATIRTETPYHTPEVKSITAGYQDAGLVGYCVETQAYGFGGLMTVLVGVDLNGEVTGVVVTEHREPNGGDALDADYLSQYIGKSGTIRKKGANAVDGLSGATTTCQAITNCVNQALSVVANLEAHGQVDYIDGEGS